MDEFNFDIKNGVVYFNDKSKLTISVANGEYSVYYDGTLIADKLDEDAELFITEIIVSNNGVEYVSDSRYDHVEVHFPNPPIKLFKATNNTNARQIPGFMAYNLRDIRQYLPGGTRHKHYGGKYAAKTIIDRIDTLQKPEIIHTANFGAILFLPGTPAVIDLGEYDGVIVLQEVNMNFWKK